MWNGYKWMVGGWWSVGGLGLAGVIFGVSSLWLDWAGVILRWEKEEKVSINEVQYLVVCLGLFVGLQLGVSVGGLGLYEDIT